MASQNESRANRHYELDPVEQVFLDAALESFSFLADEFGMELRQIDALHTEARAPHLITSIVLADGGPGVSLLPIQRGARIPRACRPVRAFGIQLLVMLVDPDHDTMPSTSVEDQGFVRTDDYQQHLDELAQLLRKHCTPFLEGRFDTWPTRKTLKSMGLDWLNSAVC